MLAAIREQLRAAVREQMRVLFDRRGRWPVWAVAGGPSRATALHDGRIWSTRGRRPKTAQAELLPLVVLIDGAEQAEKKSHGSTLLGSLKELPFLGVRRFVSLKSGERNTKPSQSDAATWARPGRAPHPRLAPAPDRSRHAGRSPSPKPLAVAQAARPHRTAPVTQAARPHRTAPVTRPVAATQAVAKPKVPRRSRPTTTGRSSLVQRPHRYQDPGDQRREPYRDGWLVHVVLPRGRPGADRESPG
jgi:hypothetical protein